MPKLDAKPIAEIPYKVLGIQCVIAVVYYHPETNEIDYKILDKNGYLADWIQRKIDEDLNKEIKNMILETLMYSE
jgi:hypothetical protein